MNLSDSVIMPREDFMELQIAAWDHVPTAPKERVAQTMQTTVVFVALGAAVAGTAWAVAKAADWLNQRDFERKLAEDKAKTAAK